MVVTCPHPLPLSRRCGKGMFADLISGAEPDADVDSPLGESV